MNIRQTEMMRWVQAGQELTSGECVKEFGVSRVVIGEDLAELVEQGLLERIGAGRGTKYRGAEGPGKRAGDRGRGGVLDAAEVEAEGDESAPQASAHGGAVRTRKSTIDDLEAEIKRLKQALSERGGAIVPVGPCVECRVKDARITELERQVSERLAPVESKATGKRWGGGGGKPESKSSVQQIQRCSQFCALMHEHTR